MPKKTLLSKRTRQDGKEERKVSGTLRLQIVSPKTESRYLEHVACFLRFLKQQGKPYLSLFSSFDFELGGFIEHLWKGGDPRSWAGDAF